jgi:hypothetical protein
MLNPDLFKFKKLDFVTAGAAVVISAISLRAFLKNYKKISAYLESIIPKDIFR